MHIRHLRVLGFGLVPLCAGCSASDDRQWMKRARGWVAVTPKVEKGPDMSDPRNFSPRSGTGKY